MARVESDLEGVCKLKTIALEEEEAPDVEQGVGREKKPVTNGTHHFSLKDKCDPSAGWSSVISRHLYILVVPGVVFCLIVALCSFGIVHATEASYNTEAKQAREAAVSAADGIAKQLSSASRAALSLAAVVRMNPNWSFLESNFEVLAQELFRQSAEEEGDLSLKELALIPFGRVTANYGTIHGGNHGDGNHGDGNNDDGNHVKGNNDQGISTGNSDHGNHGDGNHGDGHTIDLFSPERIEETGPYRSMEQRGLTVSGPIPFAGTQERAFAARYPVFFNDTDEDESWGHPDNITHPTGCSGPPCYDPATRKKFWGFIGGVVSAEPLLRGDNVHLQRLLSDGLSYSLTTSFLAGTGGPGTLVSGGRSPEKVTANVSVNLPGTSWAISVYDPRLDEIVQLRKGLLAMVVVVSSILSVLLLLLLLSSKRASVCLQEQLVTNQLLEEEKVSRETLLGRQLDLLNCFEQATKRTRNMSRSKLSQGQLSTLDRIATARQAITDVRRSRDDDVIVKELLAEGSFGKVYRGTWRGTDVAVKIIMLPGNMSGREKKEKMVVWEAAISSTLIHPNVCQTYHYRIKPIKETSKPDLEKGNCASAVLLGGQGGCEQEQIFQTECKGRSASSSPEEVHSYEVQLVLEYCDRSSLRDALDAGLFMTPTGVNYAAMLDCAMDVAKAMLHLHCNNVLHLDLKTRNILLASSGAEGKGVTCKVSDFGLSVYMDHLETHVSSLFQGTMTHMAPEVLLKGTCSKASDVYAFGIVLWELYTGSAPFHDVPPALLGHLIVKDGKRPAWPSSVPRGYRDLADACWDQDPDARPPLQIILEELTHLRSELGGPTPPLLLPYPAPCPRSKQPRIQVDRTRSRISSPQLNSIDSRNLHFLQAKLPSTPSQAEFFRTKSLSALAQAQPRTSKEVFEQKGQKGPSLLEMGKEDEGVTHSADFFVNMPGKGDLPHSKAGSWEGGIERASTSIISSHSMRGLLTTSVFHTLQAQESQGPGSCSVSPLIIPHTVVPCASSTCLGISSSSKGGLAISPFRFGGLSHSEPCIASGGNSEKQLASNAERGFASGQVT